MILAFYYNAIPIPQNGTIAHEIGHAVGFWHEHSRPDRDLYVRVVGENVKEGKISNFERRTWGEIVNLNLPYDPGSDMHYGSKVEWWKVMKRIGRILVFKY